MASTRHVQKPKRPRPTELDRLVGLWDAVQDDDGGGGGGGGGGRGGTICGNGASAATRGPVLWHEASTNMKPDTGTGTDTDSGIYSNSDTDTCADIETDNGSDENMGKKVTALHSPMIHHGGRPTTRLHEQPEGVHASVSTNGPSKLQNHTNGNGNHHDNDSPNGNGNVHHVDHNHCAHLTMTTTTPPITSTAVPTRQTTTAMATSGDMVFQIFLSHGSGFCDFRTLMRCRLTSKTVFHNVSWTIVESSICKYFLLTNDIKQAADHAILGGWRGFIDFLIHIGHEIQSSFAKLGIHCPPKLYRAAMAQQAIRRVDGSPHPLLFDDMWSIIDGPPLAKWWHEVCHKFPHLVDVDDDDDDEEEETEEAVEPSSEAVETGANGEQRPNQDQVNDQNKDRHRHKQKAYPQHKGKNNSDSEANKAGKTKSTQEDSAPSSLASSSARPTASAPRMGYKPRKPTVELCFGPPRDYERHIVCQNGWLRLPRSEGYHDDAVRSLLSRHVVWVAQNAKEGSLRRELAASGEYPYVFIAQDGTDSYTAHWVLALDDEDRASCKYLFPYVLPTEDSPFKDTEHGSNLSKWLVASPCEVLCEWKVRATRVSTVLGWSTMAKATGIQPFAKEFDFNESKARLEEDNQLQLGQPSWPNSLEDAANVLAYCKKMELLYPN